MGNARIYHTDEIKQFFAQKKIRIQFLPPYTPQFNPIEEVFAMLKSRYHKIRPLAKTKQDIFRYVAKVIEEISNDKKIIFAFFYKHMQTFVKKGLDREAF